MMLCVSYISDSLFVCGFMSPTAILMKVIIKFGNQAGLVSYLHSNCTFEPTLIDFYNLQRCFWFFTSVNSLLKLIYIFSNREVL